MTPAAGTPSSILHFGFRARQVSGRQASIDVSYTLSVIGRAGAGCVSQHSVPVPVTTANEAVTAALGPAQLGGRWCAEAYVARVDELGRPSCTAGQVCPEFIRLIAAFGPTRFVIRP